MRKKILAKKRWDIQRDEESKQEYKEMRRKAKKEVSKAKSKTYDKLYEGLDQGRRHDIVPIGETEKSSRKGRTTGQNDEG